MRIYVGLCVLALALTQTQSVVAESGDYPTPGPTQLFGHITADRVLTAASPGPDYAVLGDVIVDAGATLTIEPGVTLHFVDYSDLLASGSDPNRSELVVYGHLEVGANGPQVQLSGYYQPSANDSWYGVTVAPGGSAHFRNTIVRDAYTAIAIRTGASAIVDRTAVLNCSYAGVYAEPDAMGALVASTAEACGIGFVIGSGLGTASADSTDPYPSIASRCGTGIVVSEGAYVRNVIAVNNGIGFRCQRVLYTATNARIDYCTGWNNNTGVIGEGGFHTLVSNSIIQGPGYTGIDGAGAFIRLEYSDVWGYGGRSLISGVRGAQCASYDAALSDPVSGDYRLGAHSLFLAFSMSDGQIGAYGPGGLGPTAANQATVVQSGVNEGRVRVVWYVGGERQRASVVRRAGLEGEWSAVAAVEADANALVRYEDGDVRPGLQYGYGIGSLMDGELEIRGEVWVTVPETRQVTIREAGRNPTRSGDLKFTITLPTSARAKLELVDLQGRCMVSEDVRGQGTQEVRVGEGTRFRSGVYWARVTQGAQTATTRVCIID